MDIWIFSLWMYELQTKEYGYFDIEWSIYWYFSNRLFKTVKNSSFLGEIWLICSIYSVVRFDAWDEVWRLIDEKKRSNGELEHGARKTNNIIFANLGKDVFFKFQYAMRCELWSNNPFADFRYSQLSCFAITFAFTENYFLHFNSLDLIIFPQQIKTIILD